MARVWAEIEAGLPPGVAAASVFPVDRFCSKRCVRLKLDTRKDVESLELVTAGVGCQKSKINFFRWYEAYGFGQVIPACWYPNMYHVPGKMRLKFCSRTQGNVHVISS